MESQMITQVPDYKIRTQQYMIENDYQEYIVLDRKRHMLEKMSGDRDTEPCITENCNEIQWRRPYVNVYDR